MAKKLEPLYGWHFFRDDGTTGEGNIPVVTGKTMRVTGELALCKHGLHFSLRAIDALQCAPGARVQYVRVEGERVLGSDKGVARRRACLWQADATRTLHEFAIWCAEQALALIDNPDPRSIKALETKRLWLDGKASDDELTAAWAAAGHAVWDADWYTARDAQNIQLENMLSELAPAKEVG